MNARELLDLPMPENDAEAATVRDYLVALLATLWDEGEGFSGKRPFGNSGWERDLYDALENAGFVRGVDAEHRVSREEARRDAHALVAQSIRALAENVR